MNRRHFLGAVSTATALLGGCVESGDEPAVRDSDGDGVVDGEDYAPKDPEVQEKSDLVTDRTPPPTATLAATPRPTDGATPAATPATTDTTTPPTTATPTRTPEETLVRVTDSYWQGKTRIEAYGARSVHAVVKPEFPRTAYDEAQVNLLAYVYPRADFVAEATSDAFRRSDGEREVTVDVDLRGAPTDARLHYIANLFPAGANPEDLTGDDVATFMETDPFRLITGGSIERAPHPDRLADDGGDGYSRNAVEGSYSLTVSGRTLGKNWTVNFVGHKSAYLNAVDRARGRSRSEYVSFELTSGTAPLLARILDSEAEANGFTGKREKVEFVIDFVQRLPYVPDDVSKGFDDYTKFILETVVELGGDCEDTAILLAAVLQAEPFNYDMILIQPPGHMAAGILTKDPQGYHYEFQGGKYSFIETTGEGWGIGDIPDMYEGEEASLYQV